MNLDTATPLQRAIYNMCLELERLPASAFQTRLVSILSDASLAIERAEQSLREKDAEIARLSRGRETLIEELDRQLVEGNELREHARTLREALEEITDSIPERYPSPTDAYVEMLQVARAALPAQGGSASAGPAEQRMVTKSALCSIGEHARCLNNSTWVCGCHCHGRTYREPSSTTGERRASAGASEGK